jgi:hypothetical protein
MVQSGRPATGDHRGQEEVSSNGGAIRPGRGATEAGPPPLWLLFPREVVEYVRENRGFVLTCVSGLLLLFWGCSVAFSRRRG